MDAVSRDKRSSSADAAIRLSRIGQIGDIAERAGSAGPNIGIGTDGDIRLSAVAAVAAGRRACQSTGSDRRHCGRDRRYVQYRRLAAKTGATATARTSAACYAIDAA